MSGNKRFEDPVILVIEGEEHRVIDLADAGRLLLTKWPFDTSRRRMAMQAVAVALRDNSQRAAARRAFVNAALEIFALRVG